MLLLSVDTSGRNGSIALVEGHENSTCDVIEVVPLQGGTFSAQLVPQISELLSKHRFLKERVGGFAVVTGPGSFTGLRVGLAAIKALAEVLVKPIAGISLLEAVAASSCNTGRVLAIIDAGRSEVFAGTYDISPDRGLKLHREELLCIADLKTARSEHIVTPDESLAPGLQEGGATVEIVQRPRTDVIARLGWLKIQAGDTVPPDQLEANYIRRSDAEIFSKPNF